MLPDRADDIAQQRVAGAMTLPVVDLLEPIDIDVGEHQLSASVASPVDLPLEQQQPDLTTKRAGELIQLRAPEVISAQPVILIRARSISDRRLAISGRVRAIGGALSAINRALLGSRLVNIAVICSLVTIRSGVVPVLGRLISIRGSLLGRHLGAIAIGGIVVAISDGVLAVIGSVLAVRGSSARVGTCPVPVRCRPRETVGGRALLERLLLRCRLVDVTFGRVRIAARRGVLAIISSSATPPRLLIGHGRRPVAF